MRAKDITFQAVNFARKVSDLPNKAFADTLEAHGIGKCDLSIGAIAGYEAGYRAAMKDAALRVSASAGNLVGELLKSSNSKL